MGKTTNGAERLAYFLAELERPEPACKIWPYPALGRGYGYVRIGHKNQLVHRLACEHRWGPPPAPRMDAAHGRLTRCESTLCFNGDHLVWKTRSQNLTDMLRDGTRWQGEGHPKSVLTDAAVLEIHARFAAGGVTQIALANEYGVSSTTIRRVVSGGGWTHLVAPIERRPWGRL